MTSTAQASGASPVDFVTFGDYGDFKPKKAQPAASCPAAKPGEFVRAAYPFQGRITADGSSGYPAEPGRYHLYISWACPWAHRSAIVRELLGLQDVISLSAVDPVRDGRGWAFRAGDGYGLDPVNGFALLREAYEATEPGYDGHVSVPVLWDKQSRPHRQQQLPRHHDRPGHAVRRLGRPGRTTCTRSSCGRRSTRSTSWSTRRSTTACTGPGSRPRRRAITRR